MGTEAPASKPRVLVVDDELQILRALRVVLREAGFEVIAAQSAPEALDLAAVKAPRAAIVDLVLPGGDGVEVTRSLRAERDADPGAVGGGGGGAEGARAGGGGG